MEKNDISKNAIVDDASQIVNSKIADGVVVKSSYIEDSIVGKNTTIGPFAHLRPNSVVGENCRIGNFCEIKNSTIGNGTKISHLAYVGDAIVGKNCNIGCGA
ncbi:MAG TPA: bifunctional UDP-N-acetylglucosamine diphosphorylase/glucosamine-1-phosphate N-acetyltransferase GlmU, partial [Clostridiales bacterium]|nr:bifunctional UDP-N-acetylglucosamine diphosphorylase/glucosamine-1-phosphate N-acetyltransferase GlmU [Clostridiales bacterium]